MISPGHPQEKQCAQCSYEGVKRTKARRISQMQLTGPAGQVSSKGWVGCGKASLPWPGGPKPEHGRKVMDSQVGCQSDRRRQLGLGKMTKHMVVFSPHSILYTPDLLRSQAASETHSMLLRAPKICPMHALGGVLGLRLPVQNLPPNDGVQLVRVRETFCKSNTAWGLWLSARSDQNS